jgi:hypothetical protein
LPSGVDRGEWLEPSKVIFVSVPRYGWLVQQAQYDLAQVRRDRIKLKRLDPA